MVGLVLLLAASAPTDACAAYEEARQTAIQAQSQAGKDNFAGRLAYGSEAVVIRARRAEAAQAAALELARTCIGDLAVAGRFQEASAIAIRAGLYDEALKLRELAK